MPMYFPPMNTNEEPDETNIKEWMDNLYGKFEQIEMARWNQSNIDTLFYAGEQKFVNSYFNFNPDAGSFQNFHFNIIQQPINMVTGYQRQHRKSVNYTPIEGSSQRSSDDFTTLVTYANNYRGILEKMSMAYEQAAVAGMVLVQPYLDFSDEPVNGTLDLKIWSFNSFMVDPYFKDPSMSDGNFVWCQQYVSKTEAKAYFPEQADLINTLSGYGNRYGKFYFLPENYNLARNDLLVLSYVWYKSKRKKKMLYNANDGICYDYADDQQHINDLIRQTGFFELIEVEVPTWKLAVVLNENLMYLGINPLHFDECPLIPVYWNYDPHIGQNYDLRVRSLTRSMRDAQFLFSRRVILNHDISESSFNSGFYRRENAIANEDDLRYSGQGKDIIIKDNGQPMEYSIQKIQANAVPPSDMELATQLADLIYKVSGVNQELMGMAGDSQTGIQEMLRQGAGLVSLQKYFDQWDVALKLLGNLEKKIIQNKWSPAKMARILGREPAPELMAKTFSKYDVLVSEGLNTTIQQQQQFVQMMQLNEALGGMIPKKFILKHATIQGKDEIIKAVEEQEQQQAEIQKQGMMLEQLKLEAQLQNLHAKSANELSMAGEREGRKEANIGLFEERLSEITQNRSMALKNKVDALEKLLLLIHTYGEKEAGLKGAQLHSENILQKEDENQERLEAKAISASNDFTIEMMTNNLPKNNIMNTGQEQNGMQNQNARSALL